VSAAPVRIIDAVGQPVRPQAGTIAQVAALPAVWEMDATIEWLVDGMIPRASVNLVSAESGTGKTWLAYAIAGAVAHGKSFIERPIAQAPVLYLDGENPLYVVKRNLADLGVGATPELHIWGGWNDDPPPGPDDPRILRFATDAKPLLIWDSLVEFSSGDEQSSTEMREFMKKFRHLAHAGATVVVLHHTGKSKTSHQYRGSTDIKASVDMAYVVTGRTRGGKLHELVLDPFKSRVAPGRRFAMQFRQGEGFVGIEPPKQAQWQDPTGVVRAIVRDNPGVNGTRIKALAKARGVSHGSVDTILHGGGFHVEPGQGAEKRYTVLEEVPAAEPTRVPDFPNPGVQEIRKSQQAP
jgi:AAA domain